MCSLYLFFDAVCIRAQTLYRKTGIEGTQTVFLFSDTQLKQEAFLEDINNILSSGQVPNLFVKDEKNEVLVAIRAIAKKMGLPDSIDELWDLFVDRYVDGITVMCERNSGGNSVRVHAASFALTRGIGFLSPSRCYSVRSNLHVVLAMSPVGSGFRNRTRMYPSLVNCTTIDWFLPWPDDGFRSVIQ